MMVRWWAAFFICGTVFPPGDGDAAIVTAVAAAAVSAAFALAGRGGLRRGADAFRALLAAVLIASALSGGLVFWRAGGRARLATAAAEERAAESPGRAGSRGTVAPRLEGGDGAAGEGFLPCSAVRPRLLGLLDDGRLSESARGMIAALVLGDRRGLEGRLRDDYSYLGIAHFLALSGLHLGAIALPVSRVLALFVRSRRLRDATLVAILFLYAAVACFPPSLLRALALAAAFAAYRFAGIPCDLAGTLIAGSFALAIVNPRLVFDAGFQLSFAAVLGIARLGAPFTRMARARLPGGIGGAVLRGLLYPAIITASVQCFTLPLTISLFRRSSLLSPLVNVLVSLPFAALLYAGALYVFVPAAPLRALLAPIVNGLGRFLDGIPAMLARRPHAAILGSDANWIAYAFGVFILSVALERSRRRRGRIVALGGAMIAVSFLVPRLGDVRGGEAAGGGRPVRQAAGARGGPARRAAAGRGEDRAGSAAALSGTGYAYFPEGGGFLFVSERFGAASARRLERELWGNGIRAIGRCIVVPSALRSNHGIFRLVERIGLRELVCSPYLAARERETLGRLEARGIPVRIVSGGSRIEGPGISVEIIGPPYPPPAGGRLSIADARLACTLHYPDDIRGRRAAAVELDAGAGGR